MAESLPLSALVLLGVAPEVASVFRKYLLAHNSQLDLHVLATSEELELFLNTPAARFPAYLLHSSAASWPAMGTIYASTLPHVLVVEHEEEVLFQPGTLDYTLISQLSPKRIHTLLELVARKLTCNEREAKVTQSLKELQAIFDSVTNEPHKLTFVVDENLELLYFSPSYKSYIEEQFGFVLSRGMSIMDLPYPSEYQRRVKANIQQAFLGTELKYTNHYPDANGKQTWYTVVMRPTAWINPSTGQEETAVSVIAENITRFKTLESELQESWIRLAQFQKRYLHLHQTVVKDTAHLAKMLAAAYTSININKAAAVHAIMESESVLEELDAHLNSASPFKLSAQDAALLMPLDSWMKANTDDWKTLCTGTQVTLQVRNQNIEDALIPVPHFASMLVQKLLETFIGLERKAEVSMLLEQKRTDIVLKFQTHLELINSALPLDIKDRLNLATQEIHGLLSAIGGSALLDWSQLTMPVCIIQIPDQQAFSTVQVVNTKQESMQFTVLAVDDNPINLTILKQVLSKLNYHVLTAGGGAQALELLQNHTVNLILMDLHMPDMDGLETSQRIRTMADSEKRNVAIVAFTADDTPDLKEKLVDLNINDYLQKPYSQIDIARIVGAYLS